MSFASLHKTASHGEKTIDRTTLGVVLLLYLSMIFDFLLAEANLQAVSGSIYCGTHS